MADGGNIRIEIDITAADNTSGVVEGIQSSLTGLQSTMENVKSAYSSMGTAMGKLPSGASRTPFAGYERSMQRFSTKLKGTKLEQAVTIHDGVTSGIKGIISKGKSLVSKPIQIATKIAAPVTNVAKAITSPLAMAGVSIGATAAVTDVVKTYSGFEAEMSKVKAISGATGAEFDSLTKKAKEMGAQTKFTSEEAGQAFEYMAMAGWKPQQMMSGINGVMRLAAASGEDLGSTSDIVTDAVTAFGHSATDTLSDGTNYVDHFVDVLAKASSASNTNVAMLGESFKYAAPLAGSLGFSVDDTARALGLMANQGIKASQAGTAMRGWLTRMAKPTKESQAAMDKLGISLTDAQGNMKSLSTIMDETRAGFQKLAPAEKTATAAQLAGQYGMTGLLAIVNSSQKDYDDLTNSIRNSAGAATDMSNTMLDNVQGKWTLFTSALDVMKNNLGERFKPYLMEGIQWLTDHVPNLQSALESGMDKVDQFASRIKQAWANITMDSDFQNADIFGKAKIVLGKAMDSIHDFAVTHAKGFGKSLGTGLHNGIMALLGVDVTGAVNEGQSIGAQFAKGFASGFKGGDIAKALLSSLGNIVKDAGTLFSGNASSTSGFSALALAYMGHQLLGGGLKLAQGGVNMKNLLSGLWGSYGSAPVTAATTLPGAEAAAASATTAEAAGAAGTAATAGEAAATGGTALAGKGIAGALGKIGTAGGAATAGGAVALGAAGVAGGVALGAGAIRAGKDLYNAAKLSKKNDKLSQQGKTAYAARGGGIIAEAATGAAIGTLVGGPIGTVIGGGIGAVAGWVMGNKAVKEYNKALDENRNYQDKAAYAAKGTKFESKELNKQFKDTKTSAESFGAALQQAINDKNTAAFGKMSLSMSELKDTAKDILFTPEQTKNLDNYQKAADTAAKSLDSLNDAKSDMDKLNWKVGASGGISDASDLETYKSAIDAYGESAKQYLTDQNYSANQATNSLLGSGKYGTSAAEMTQQNDATYSELQKRLEKANSEVQNQYNSAMSDNVISSAESAAIQKAQGGVQKITDMVNQSALDASKSELATRYSGAALDASSYGNLVSEMSTQGKTAADSYKQAFTQQASTLNLAKAMGTISDTDYQKSMDSITQGYQKQLGDITSSMSQFGMNSIKDAFKLDDNTASQLTKSMGDALKKNTDFSNMGLTDAQKLFGLDKLKLPEESKDAITQDMMQLGAGLSQMLSGADLSSVLENVRKNAQKGLESDNEQNGVTDQSKSKLETPEIGMTDSEKSKANAQKLTKQQIDDTANAVDNADTSPIQESVSKKNKEMDDSFSAFVNGATGTEGTSNGKVSALTDGIQQALIESVNNMDTSQVGPAIQTKLGEAMTAGLTSGQGGEGGQTDTSGIAQGLQQSLTSSIESMDLTEIGTPLQAKIGEALSAGISSGEGESGSTDASGIALGLQQSISSSIESMDLSEIGAPLQNKIGEALSSGLSSGEGGGEGDVGTAGIVAGLHASIASSIESMDLADVGSSLQAKIGEALSGLGSGGGTEGGGGDMSGIAEGIQASLSSALSSLDLSGIDMSGIASTLQGQITSSLSSMTFDFSGVGAGIGSSLGSAIASASGWQGGVSTLYSNVGNAIRGQFAGGYDVTTTVRVTINWTITNPSAGISTSASGNSVHASIGGHANGGFIDSAELSWVGEDGPEYVIPVGAKRKGRGLDLWQQAGRDLGVPGFADGGLVGSGPVAGDSSMASLPSSISDDTMPIIPTTVSAPQAAPGTSDAAAASTTQTGPVSVNFTPTFNVSGGDTQDVVQQVMAQMDDVVGDLADRISEIFGNMPVNATT